MRRIEQLYINGGFVKPHGTEVAELINPTTEVVIATLILSDAEDTRHAIAAAKAALTSFAKTTKEERIAMLKRLNQAVLARTDELRDITIEEYGGPLSRATWIAQYSSQAFLDAAQTLESYDFVRCMGRSSVVMEPVGVSALIIPWNSVAGTICSKLSMAIAAGCTGVIKPSELGALQAQVVTEALHDAGLPLVPFGKLGERLMQGHHLPGLFVGIHERVLQRDLAGAAAPLLGVPGSRMIDQNPAHDLRGHSEEMRPVLPVDAMLAHQPQIGFIDQGAGLERVVAPFAPHVVAGKAV